MVCNRFGLKKRSLPAEPLSVKSPAGRRFYHPAAFFSGVGLPFGGVGVGRGAPDDKIGGGDWSE